MFLDNKDKGSITIEGSIVFILFISGYLILNSISMSLMVESLTRKAIFEVGMDISNYVQIIDRIGFNEYIKTDEIEIEDYKNIIIEQLDDEIDENTSGEIFNALIDKFRKNISSESKKVLINKLIKKLFLYKLSNIRPSQDIKSLGKIENFDFSETKLLSNGNQIEIRLKYKFKLDRLGLLTITNDVSQTFLTDTWINNNKKNIFNSIWDESNFDRGRYFASKIRNESEIGLKTGKWFDYYNKDTNTLVQVISLNIFNKTYSEKIGDKYIIEDEFIEIIKKYNIEMKKNVKKIGNNMEKLNGGIIKLNNPNVKLQIIMPEESIYKTDLENYLNFFTDIENIEFVYMEKALND